MSLPKDAAVLAAGSTIPVLDFVEQFRGETIPLSNAFSYFFLAAKPTEDDMKEFVDEPIAALPPAVAALLPRVHLFFVPFLEHKNGGRRQSIDQISLGRPEKGLAVSRISTPDQESWVFPFADRDTGEHHYRFYQTAATMAAERSPDVEKGYLAIVRHELRSNTHGEVDEPSWERKIALLERQSLFHGSNKALRDYARQSLIDTLTLYLHGICCDLDVETGPRQLASRHLRKRLEFLELAFPPPKGYAVFPEELKEV
jgi:hypothetical protein